MPEIHLSPRLQGLLDCIQPDLCTVDIGTDHGLLAVAAALQANVKHIVASDLNELPLQAARRTVAMFGLEGSVTVRRSDGLQQIRPCEMQQIVIAGMGGRLIRAILEQCQRHTPQKFASCRYAVLQPMNYEGELRSWLASIGWPILSEKLVAENQHFYQIILTTPGDEPYELTWLERLIGPCLLRQPTDLMSSFLEREIAVRRRVLKEIEAGSDDEQRSERAERRSSIVRDELKALQDFFLLTCEL